MNLKRPVFHLAMILSGLVLMSGCASRKSLMSSKEGTYDYYALKDALGSYLNKPVKVYIGDVQIECTLSGLESDRVIIRQAEGFQEIPVRAITRIEMADLRTALTSTGLTSVAGGAFGWLVGRVVSSKVLSDKLKNFEADEQVAVAAAGATVGFLVGAWIGSSNHETLDINPNVEPLILDRVLGRAITETQRQQYGIFNDLPLQENESLAGIQIMQYGPTDYLVLYDSFERKELPKYAYDGREMTIKIPVPEMQMHWMPVSRDYLVKQQDKVHHKLGKDGQSLKYKLFQQ